MVIGLGEAMEGACECIVKIAVNGVPSLDTTVPEMVAVCGVVAAGVAGFCAKAEPAKTIKPMSQFPARSIFRIFLLDSSAL